MDEEELTLFNENNDTIKSIISEPISLNYRITLSVIYGIILVTGISGNISTCIVIGRYRSMHTSTNIYLCSLSISNTFLLISGLPLEVFRLWNGYSYQLGEAFYITIELISQMATNATVLTITAFTFETYMELSLMSHMMSNLSRVLRCIIGIWISALCAAVPQVMQFGIVSYEKKEPIDGIYTEKGHGTQILFSLSSIIIFLVHMFLITVLYVMIFFKLHKSSDQHQLDKNSESADRSIGTPRFKIGASQRRVIRMLVAVVVIYFLCLAPFYVQKLVAIYGKTLDTIYKVNLVLTHLAAVLYFLSAAINPFLYYIMSNKFKNAFKVTLTSWCRLRNRSRLERTFSAQLASQKKRAEEKVLKRTRNLRQQRRLLDPSSQLCDAPPLSQIRAEARTLQRPRHPRQQRHLLADSSQIRNVSPRPQSINRTNLTVVNIERSWLSRQQLAERSDTLTSPQSISNSSLRELDQEQNKEELATYLHQVNCEIKGETRNTSV